MPSPPGGHFRKGASPKTIDVLTLGPHARRTRLVYAKVLAPTAQVGVVAWVPSDYESNRGGAPAGERRLPV